MDAQELKGRTLRCRMRDPTHRRPPRAGEGEAEGEG